MFVEKEYFPWERVILTVQEAGRMPATGGKSPLENLNPITTSERMTEAETTVTCTKSVTPASLASSIVAVARSATTRNLAENRTQPLVRRGQQAPSNNKRKNKMIYQCKGRFVKLVELTTDNEFDLFQLMNRNRSDYERLVSNQKVPIDYTEFKETLNTWFLHGRAYQFLVYSIQSNQEQAIGTIFFYGLNKEQQSVKISVFFDTKERGKVKTAESLGLAISFARKVMNVKCLRFSIYSNNQRMLKLAHKIASHFEGFGRSNQEPKKEVQHYTVSEENMDSILLKLVRLYR